MLKRFFRRVVEKAPFKIQKVLTDNGKRFTDRFTSGGERNPTGQRPFDQAWAEHHVERRRIRPCHPQTNAEVERFNGRISDVLAMRRYVSEGDLEQM